MSGLSAALQATSGGPHQQAVLVDIALFVLVLAYVLYRQLHVRPVTTRTFLLVAILVFYGLVSGIPTAGPGVVFLVASLAISIGFGIWRGASMHMWRATDGVVYRRGTAITVTLWGVTVLAKSVLDGFEVSATDTFTAGTIWLAMGVTLAVQQSVMITRAKALTTH